MMETQTKLTTALCDSGNHGTPERRTRENQGWKNMWTGKCAGTVYSLTENRTIGNCECECHNAEGINDVR